MRKCALMLLAATAVGLVANHASAADLGEKTASASGLRATSTNSLYLDGLLRRRQRWRSLVECRSGQCLYRWKRVSQQ